MSHWPGSSAFEGSEDQHVQGAGLGGGGGNKLGEMQWVKQQPSHRSTCGVGQVSVGLLQGCKAVFLVKAVCTIELGAVEAPLPFLASSSCFSRHMIFCWRSVTSIGIHDIIFTSVCDGVLPGKSRLRTWKFYLVLRMSTDRSGNPKKIPKLNAILRRKFSTPLNRCLHFIGSSVELMFSVLHQSK